MIDHTIHAQEARVVVVTISLGHLLHTCCIGIDLVSIMVTSLLIPGWDIERMIWYKGKLEIAGF